jgi:hypothetical protein
MDCNKFSYITKLKNKNTAQEMTRIGVDPKASSLVSLGIF